MTRRDVNDPFVHPDEERGIALVFGLHWMPLIGSHARRDARQRAAVFGASHYACAGDSSVTLGVIDWPRHTDRIKPGLHGAAAAAIYAARAGQGLHLDIYRLSDQRYWLVGARAGVVLSRTDRLFVDADAARQARAEVCRAVGIDELASVAVPIEVCPDFTMGSVSGATLHRLTGLEGTVRRYRWPLLAASVMSLGAVFSTWRSSVPDVQLVVDISDRSGQDLIIAKVDPVDTWIAALHEQWRGAPELTAIYDRFRQLPVRLDGWALAHARCLLESDTWACRAQYVRDDGRATNQALAGAVSSEWSVSFTPVDHAYLSWREVQAGQTVEWGAWPESAEVDLTWISALQDIAPAFTHLSIGAPETFSMPPDPGRIGPEPGPVWPDGLPVRRAIDAQGPMRSFALWPRAPHTVWTEAALTVRESSSEGLTDSRIHMLIRGWIHERNHAAG